MDHSTETVQRGAVGFLVRQPQLVDAAETISGMCHRFAEVMDAGGTPERSLAMLVGCDVEGPKDALGVVAMERASVAQLVMAYLKPVVDSFEPIRPDRAPSLEDLDLNVGISPRAWRTALEVDDQRAVVLPAQLDLVGVVR